MTKSVVDIFWITLLIYDGRSKSKDLFSWQQFQISRLSYQYGDTLVYKKHVKIL
jgi:hypothetical protein